MARENLTDKRVSMMKPPADGRREVVDTARAGLRFRITASGTRTWSVVYRLNGGLARHTIGPYPRIGLAKARKLAAEALELVGQGIDPRVARATAEAAESSRQTDTVEAAAVFHFQI